MELRHLTREEKLEYIISYYEEEIPKQVALLKAYKQELLELKNKEQNNKTFKIEKRN